MAGFVIVPAVVLFDLDKQTGAGLVFQTLPMIFGSIGGGKILAVLFFLALLGAGISTTIAVMEIPINAAVEVFNLDRKKAVIAIAVVTTLGAIPCIWANGYLDALDWIVNNIGYNFSAAFTAITLAWWYKAKRCREELMNPGSDFAVGKWFDPAYKFLVCACLVWFCFEAIKALVVR